MNDPVSGVLVRNNVYEIHHALKSSAVNVKKSKSYLLLKRALDIFISLFVIIAVLSWLCPIIAILIIVDSNGSVFFRQRRIGLNGKIFTCYKFRSMVINPDADKKQASQNDPRITQIGKFLRLSCIDELPQFFNVLMGEMSLVGPRPHMISDCDEFSKQLGNYHFRHIMKPGITGVAQIKGYRGKTSGFLDVFHRYQLDAFYIRNANIKLDFWVLYKTFLQLYFVITGIKGKKDLKKLIGSSFSYSGKIHSSTDFSIVIVTKNAQNKISRLLGSIQGLSEDVIVCDTGSTDATVEIAQAKGAKVYHIPWEGYGKSKNYAIEFAKYDWILSLDSDEKIDKELYNMLLKWVPQNNNSVYQVLWKNFFGNQWIKYSDWNSSWKNRLFNKTIASWDNSIAHENITSPGAISYIKLNGRLEHYSFSDEKEYFSKMKNSARLTAIKYHLAHKRSTWFHLIFSPTICFVKTYFFRLGFLDGSKGWLIAKTSASYSLMKYRML